MRVYFSAVLSTEYNRILIFKEPIPDKALPGRVIRTEKVIDEGSWDNNTHSDDEAVLSIGLFVIHAIILKITCSPFCACTVFLRLTRWNVSLPVLLYWRKHPLSVLLVM